MPDPELSVEQPREEDMPRCLGLADALMIDLEKLGWQLEEDGLIDTDTHEIWDRVMGVLEKMVQNARESISG